MQAGVGGFAHGVQAGHVCAAGPVDNDAATGVVGRRHHRHRLAAGIQAKFQAPGQDGGEVRLHEIRRAVADVQIHAVRAEPLHFVVDGAGHHVPRRQFAATVESFHEAFAVRQKQSPAFAAQGFGDEERACRRVEQTGGVELVELHVRNAATRSPRHGDAVAGGAVRVAGVEVHLAGTAGGEHHERRFDHLHGVGPAIVDVSAHHPVRCAAQLARGDQIDGHAAGSHFDVRVRGRLGAQRLGDGGAGGVRHVQHPAMRVAAFPGEMRAAAIVVETQSQADQMLDDVWRPPDGEAHDVFVAQPGAGRHRVRHVRLEGVVRCGDRGDAALGAIGGAAANGVLRKHRHAHRVRQTQRRGETGGPAADDQDVCSVSVRQRASTQAVEGARV